MEVVALYILAHVGLTVGLSFTIIVAITIQGVLKFEWGF